MGTETQIGPGMGTWDGDRDINGDGDGDRDTNRDGDGNGDRMGAQIGPGMGTG